MTDMHREGFDLHWEIVQQDPRSIMYNNPLNLPVDGDIKGWASLGWQAAMRYRDEQACCDCAYTCKFCRDEQEKQA